MPDTIRGYFPDVPCSDCGEIGSSFNHWGPLVPKGAVGSFCMFCWTERCESKGDQPKPLGVQSPGIPQEFLNKKLKVMTESGSMYELTPTGKTNEVFVLRNFEKVSFVKARVLCLAVGKQLFLKPRDGDDFNVWYTTPVVSVEPQDQ